jgi:hypothetical protein
MWSAELHRRMTFAAEALVAAIAAVTAVRAVSERLMPRTSRAVDGRAAEGHAMAGDCC